MININNNIESECYWCGAPATSREHVPPKCLFPELKDIASIYNDNFRKDLITVPSCYEHNLNKSKEDEILMACLAPALGNNGVAYIHTQTKLQRAFSRNTSLRNSAFRVLKEDNLKIDKYTFPVLIVEVDNLKMLKSFEGIARGLYFYEFKQRFIGKCKIIPKYLNMNPKIANYIALIELMAEQEQSDLHINGANPQIFTYQFSPIDQYQLRGMTMTFYGKLKVYVAFQPDGVELPFK